MSSSDLAISIRGLSKSYQIGQIREKHSTLAEATLARLRNPLQSQRNETFWALEDISLDVNKGEVVGVIGRNGAGKSTLLKILSRITEPTSGEIDLYGRVGSLLEVGTGFHPELTGRENVYLNGSLFGMSKAEIRKQFDAIVDFAEIGTFIDTPVKRYSSGMYVRLAFAVAAHLESDILIVDEVLSVGDTAFQKRCLGKMNDVSQAGRTVLVVSHQMSVITLLCRHAVILHRGRLTAAGATDEVVAQYLSSDANRRSTLDLGCRRDRSGSGKMRFVRAGVTNGRGEASDKFMIGEDLVLEFELQRLSPVNVVKIGVQLTTADGLNLAHMVDQDSAFSLTQPDVQETVRLCLHDLRLYPGTYLLSLWAGDTTSTEAYDALEHCLRFDIVGGGKLTSRSLPRSAGLFFLTPTWCRVGQPLRFVTTDGITDPFGVKHDQ